MSVFTDQLGHRFQLNQTPQRIISLVPSQTELLYTLGLDNNVVGITKFCVHPAQWHQYKKRIGGTKNINFETIRQLQPDLIIANKEENNKEQVEALQAVYPVYTSDINNLEEALVMIEQIGRITHTQAPAAALIENIKQAFDTLQPFSTPVNTAYLIWQDPFMTVGGDTFINHQLATCGFKNIFSHRQRYPVVTIQELQQANCQLLLLSSEPYPFKDKHIAALQKQLPHTRIALADGEYFSWYGSRLVNAPAYFKELMTSLA